VNGSLDETDLLARQLRVERLRHDNQFGCHGRHHGNGGPDCPRQLHHHHDIFCIPPSQSEWSEAGREGPVRISER
jgi:hypothetical protein